MPTLKFAYRVLAGGLVLLGVSFTGNSPVTARTLLVPAPPPPVVLVDSFGVGDTLNPWQAFFPSDYPVNGLLFGHLITFNAMGEPVPGLLQTVPTFENHLAIHGDKGLDLILDLKHGLKWSDGQSITSDDLVFTWKVNDLLNVISDVSSFDTPTASRAVVHFIGDAPGYLDTLASMIPLPHQNFLNVDQAAFKLGQDPKATYTDGTIATAGPFVVDSFKPGTSVMFGKNPHYADPAPRLPMIELKGFSNLNDAVASLGTTVDAISNLPLSEAPAAATRQNVQVVAHPGSSYESLIPNPNRGPLADVRVRQAMSLAIERAALCPAFERIVLDCSAYLRRPYYESIDLNPPATAAYNPDRAAQILRDAGYDGTPITLDYLASSAGLANRLGAMLDKVGFNIALTPVSASNLFSSKGILAGGTFDIVLLNQATYHSQDAWLQHFLSSQAFSAANPGGSNLGGVHDAAFDARFSDGVKVYSPAARSSLLNALTQYVFDNAYEIPLYIQPNLAATDGNIVNFDDNQSDVAGFSFLWGDKRVDDKPLSPPSPNDASAFQFGAGSSIDGLTSTSYETGIEQTKDQWIIYAGKDNGLFSISSLALAVGATDGEPSAQDARDIEVQVSTTGTADADFTSVGRVTALQQPGIQRFALSTAVQARYIKLILHSNYGSQNFISLAEVQVIGLPASGASAVHTAVGVQAHAIALRPLSAATSLGTVRFIARGLSVTHLHHHAQKAKVKMPVLGRDLLQTAGRQRASLAFRDGTVLDMNQHTDIVLSDPHTTLVKRGEVDQIMTPGTDHQVTTAAAVTAAIGANWDVQVTGVSTRVVVVEGVVQVQNAQGTVILKTGQQTTVTTGSAPTAPTPVDANAVVAWTQGIPKANLPYNIVLEVNGGHVVSSSS